ncbi:MAG: hypothetical protein LBJ09_03080 [Clostridiales bacterium]|nr:hypothetical protein [Clostridiales bacterium]
MLIVKNQKIRVRCSGTMIEEKFEEIFIENLGVSELKFRLFLKEMGNFFIEGYIGDLEFIINHFYRKKQHFFEIPLSALIAKFYLTVCSTFEDSLFQKLYQIEISDQKILPHEFAAEMVFDLDVNALSCSVVDAEQRIFNSRFFNNFVELFFITLDFLNRKHYFLGNPFMDIKPNEEFVFCFGHHTHPFKNFELRSFLNFFDNTVREVLKIKHPNFFTVVHCPLGIGPFFLESQDFIRIYSHIRSDHLSASDDLIDQISHETVRAIGHYFETYFDHHPEHLAEEFPGNLMKEILSDIFFLATEYIYYTFGKSFINGSPVFGRFSSEVKNTDDLLRKLYLYESIFEEIAQDIHLAEVETSRGSKGSYLCLKLDPKLSFVDNFAKRVEHTDFSFLLHDLIIFLVWYHIKNGVQPEIPFYQKLTYQRDFYKLLVRNPIPLERVLLSKVFPPRVVESVRGYENSEDMREKVFELVERKGITLQKIPFRDNHRLQHKLQLSPLRTDL